MKTIKQLIEENEDYDVLIYRIAQFTGVVPEDPEDHPFHYFREYKEHWVMSTTLHDAIYGFLQNLEKEGIIVWNGGRFLWNETYDLDNYKYEGE